MKKERIGLFGGTFNPVHSGHIRAAEIVQKRFVLDKILFIPSYIPPHKESADIAAPRHRMEMVKLAVSSSPGFVPSSIEIEEEGTSYSIFTLKKIRMAYPDSEIFFILGIDAFLEIDTWKDTQEVLQQCSFIVVNRPGYSLKEAHGVLGAKHSLVVLQEDVDVIDQTGPESSAKIFLLTIDALDVSSSEIRRRIQEGSSIKGMVPAGVETYLINNKLYQEKQ
jgi:nicotinate-nucleotide adenylyltransferase